MMMKAVNNEVLYTQRPYSEIACGSGGIGMCRHVLALVPYAREAWPI